MDTLVLVTLEFEELVTSALMMTSSPETNARRFTLKLAETSPENKHRHDTVLESLFSAGV